MFMKHFFFLQILQIENIEKYGVCNTAYTWRKLASLEGRRRRRSVRTGYLTHFDGEKYITIDKFI